MQMVGAFAVSVFVITHRQQEQQGCHNRAVTCFFTQLYLMFITSLFLFCYIG